MKYIIATLTFILFLFGLTEFTIQWFTFEIDTPILILTIFTFYGFICSFANSKNGLIVILMVAIGWLIKYFEQASFLIFYNSQNTFGRWVLTLFPLVLAIILLICAYKSKQRLLDRKFKFHIPIIIIFIIFLIDISSFIRKPHNIKLNCWYFIDNNKSVFRVQFSQSPEKIFELKSDSQELKRFALENGIRDQSRDGIYCPETKLRVVTKFRKIVSITVLGFGNSKNNYFAKLSTPVEISLDSIEGDKSILEPDFAFR